MIVPRCITRFLLLGLMATHAARGQEEFTPRLAAILGATNGAARAHWGVHVVQVGLLGCNAAGKVVLTSRGAASKRSVDVVQVSHGSRKGSLELLRLHGRGGADNCSHLVGGKGAEGGKEWKMV